MLPLEFRDEVNHEKTRVMGLLCGEIGMILYFQPFLTDPLVWRTDRQTDGQQRIALYAYSIYAAVR